MSFASRRRLALVVAVALMLAMTLPSTAGAAGNASGPTGFSHSAGPVQTGVGAQAVFAKDAYEPDNTAALAKVGTGTTYHTFDTSASVPSTSDDVDWFKFTTTASSTPIWVNLYSATEEGQGFDVTLYRGADASGTSMAAVVASGTSSGSYRDYSVVATPATYFMRVASTSGDGAYKAYLEVGDAVRIGGANRYETAVEICQKMNPMGTGSTESRVFLATGAQYADALAASPFGARTHSPILLTNSQTLTAVTAAELDRVSDDTTVYLLGGTAAISTAVENAVKAIDGVQSVKRLAGTDRYGTAAAVAREFVAQSAGASIVNTTPAEIEDTSTVPVVFVASGQNFADALAVGPPAASTHTTFTILGSMPATWGASWSIRAGGAPVVLTLASSLPSATSQYLRDVRPRQVYVLGGSAAVATSVVNSIKSVVASGTAVDRIAGADRYETALKVADYGRAKASLASSLCVLVSGGPNNWPDALAVAPWTIGSEAIMLTQPTVLSTAVRSFFVHNEAMDTSWGNYAIGGPLAMSPTAFNAFRDLWKTDF